MNDLLAQLKEEFEPKRQLETHNKKSSSHKSPQPPQNQASKQSMEQMLTELRTELESGREQASDLSSKPQVSPKPNQTSASSNLSKYRNRLNALIDQDYQMQERKREAKFAEIKRQEEARIAEQKRRQQELIEAQRREELRERRRKEALREKAQQWLKNLNLRSEEGRWFEEFSYSYEDKLQAAIDYLEAMRESGL
ncbi:salt stress protein, Slr1339 family [Pleurocapsa sp. PCC 7319]|uniref:salt stress protein, Slr1339 family n=1 Tax=Pleurocapsa sp. PCC 7319 TaxID=118161 RepID=UPI0003453928|nr:hypothetical protein [Pleurocapsa sp. PCC 7319]